MREIGIDEVKRHYGPGIGRHWFDRDTMRFFRCRLSDTAYVTEDGARAYFVTSEQNHGFGGPYPRLYSVRVYDFQTREIDTVGAFQEFGTRPQAVSAAKRYARQNTAVTA